MNNASPQPEQPPTDVKRPSVNWALWIGSGIFGGAGIALIITLTNFWGPEIPITSSDIQTSVENAPASKDALPQTTPQNDLREHQAIVRDVVNDLEREFLIGDSPTKGNPDADIVLFEFSDFQCSYCARATTEVEAFLDVNESEVLFVYKHLPLNNLHQEAMSAAFASWAAQQQDQFWPFHDALFANQDRLGEPLYTEIARELELDIEQFDRDRASEAAKAAIARDLALAAEMQLNSTPTFIMDDLLIPGTVPAEFFNEVFVRLKDFKAKETETTQ